MTSDSSPTILIVDNDEGVVCAIASRLKSLGYACVTAETGAQGISAFRSRKIDLVITDLNMPVGDGISLAKSLRNVSDVPIIFVTGFRDEYKPELLSIRNVSVLRKPFDTSVLIDLVEVELALRS